MASLMGSRADPLESTDGLIAGLARLGITVPRLETLLATLADPDLVEKVANQARTAVQAPDEARALTTEAQEERTAAEAVWREVDRIRPDFDHRDVGVTTTILGSIKPLVLRISRWMFPPLKELLK
jgi:hypothetical protein